MQIRNPEARLGASNYAEIKSHPFFNEISWDELPSQTPPPLLPYLPSAAPAGSINAESQCDLRSQLLISGAEEFKDPFLSGSNKSDLGMATIKIADSTKKAASADDKWYVRNYVPCDFSLGQGSCYQMKLLSIKDTFIKGRVCSLGNECSC